MTKSFARLAGSLICLLSVAFACQTTKDVENEVIILDTREAVKIEKELKLSDIAQSIEYVKLETNPDCLISSGTSLIVGKKYILFLNRQPAKLFLFERSGRFLREIGKLGKGPGEYERPSDIDLNSTEDKVLVTSAGYPCKINEYAITGEFIRSGELPHWTEGGVQYMPTGNFIYVQGRPFTDVSDR